MGLLAKLRIARENWWLLLSRPLELDIRRVAGHARGRFLDLGSGNLASRPIFKDAIGIYVGVDPWLGSPHLSKLQNRSLPRTHLVHADGRALPFLDRSFDTILCTQVIEHVPDFWEIFREIDRVAAEGAVLILSAPQSWFVHGAPNDYYRFTRYGLRHLAERAGFEVVLERWQGGPIALAGQAIVNFLDYNVFGRQGPMRWFSVLIEIACHFLDRVVRPANANLDRWDTMNNLLVARRKSPGVS